MSEAANTTIILPDDPAAQRALIAALQAKVAILEEQLRLASAERFARKSEKFASLDQLNLFNEAEVTASTGDDATDPPAITVPEHSRERGKRRPIDAKLPRVRIEHDIPDAAKTCLCGCALSRIGETVSEQLDIEPAKARVIQNVRFKYACRSCEGASHDGPAVITAPLPAQPIPKSNASPGLLAMIATMKFQDGIPHYRQEGILARSGIDLPRATAASWMIRIGQLVTPLIIRKRSTIHMAAVLRF